jgi:two-component system, OmpR family, phosphate regulon sensor histidine kinase PhoR
MRPGKLFWKLFLGNIVLVAAVLALCMWLIALEVERFADAELTRALEVQGTALREVVAERFDPAHAAELDQLAKRIGQKQANYLRVTLILEDGTVLADSEADPATMEPHDDRPEFKQAMKGVAGEDMRQSHTLGRMMKYVALPVGVTIADGAAATERPRAKGVLRVAMPVRTISEQAGSIQRLVWGTGVLALVAAAALALGLARLWSRPIHRITLAAQSLSRGNLATRVQASGSDELALLGRSLNEMRGRLSAQLETIDRQRRTLASMLSELHEGVIVSGPDARIVLINPAAVRMMGLPAQTPEAMERLTGQAVEAIVARHELQQMLQPVMGVEPTSAERNGIDKADTIREVRLPSPEGGAEISVLARASNVVLPAFGKDAEHRPGRPGRLLVLADVTAMTRMVQVKADFAANASHELRTPLAAIRAALETLAPMDFAAEADSARHFFEVIQRHSRRLELLVADLLELSRLESSRAQFQPAEVRLRELIDDICGERAEAIARKEVTCAVDRPEGLNSVYANPHLLRITLDNLIDNAIKFAPVGGQVSVTLRRERTEGESPESVSIQVADNGCGIAPDEQARVFERFYQVERARSGGVLRGTGLGLSIVRHAVAAMKGTIKLESEVGKGTRVTVVIPQTDEGQ